LRGRFRGAVEPGMIAPVTNAEHGDPLASFRLDDRLIVVTGASEGIGRAFAECFARAGALVVLASRRKDKLESVRQAIVSSGGSAEVVATDVTRLEDIGNLADAVGRLAPDRRLVLVNNAGFGFTKPALEVSEQDWDTLFNTHVKGAFFCSQRIAPLMLERGYGKIINLSSAWSAASDTGKSAYGAAKAAISHLTAQLSTEWAPSGVRVNAIAPTATLTDFVARTMAASPERANRLLSRIKLGRFAQTSDLLGTAVFLASGASDFVTGQTLFVDGGFTT
jgi:NAD(P)-dependent dehydrogenase (short-subunit alcohol dehydrogenase family)